MTESDYPWLPISSVHAEHAVVSDSSVHATNASVIGRHCHLVHTNPCRPCLFAPQTLWDHTATAYFNVPPLALGLRVPGQLTLAGVLPAASCRGAL